MKIICFYILLLICSNSFSQIKYLDKRDSAVYNLMKIDSIWWMTENLSFNSFNIQDYNDNCDSCGYLYTYNSAKNVCPLGLRLPTIEEWNKVFEYYGGKLLETDQEYGIYYSGIKRKITEIAGINLNYCGAFRKNPFTLNMEFDNKSCNYYASYWAFNKIENQFKGIHFEKDLNSDWVGTVKGDEFTGFSVRCVMDE